MFFFFVFLNSKFYLRIYSRGVGGFTCMHVSDITSYFQISDISVTGALRRQFHSKAQILLRYTTLLPVPYAVNSTAKRRYYSVIQRCYRCLTPSIPQQSADITPLYYVVTGALRRQFHSKAQISLRYTTLLQTFTRLDANECLFTAIEAKVKTKSSRDCNFFHFTFYKSIT